MFPEGVIITDPDLVLQQWKNYFQRLLNSNDKNVVQEPELDPPPPEPHQLIQA